MSKKIRLAVHPSEFFRTLGLFISSRDLSASTLNNYHVLAGALMRFELTAAAGPLSVIGFTTPLLEKVEVAANHIVRRTFIGTLYRQVKDPNLISSLTGHVENSREFNRYRTIEDDIKRELIMLL